MAFLPRLAHSRPSHERTGGARTTVPRMVDVLAFCRLQGLAPSESPCRVRQGLCCLAGRSPPGLTPPEGLPVPKLGEFHPLRSRAWPHLASTVPLAVPRRSPTRLHPSVSGFDDSATLSRERLPLRGFPPSDPHPRREAQLWLIALRLSPRTPGGVTAPRDPLRTVVFPYLAAG